MIAAITYRKNVKDLWSESDFLEQVVPVVTGGSTRMRLARRETELGTGKDRLPVTEIRRMTSSGHQTAITTTGRTLCSLTVTSHMFARWCQENYFAHMMQHYDIDGLIEYGAESIPGTTEVVNPSWRVLDKSVRQTRQKVRKHQADLPRAALTEGNDIQQNAESLEALQAIQAELEKLCAQRKATPRKVTIESLPEAARPSQLLPLRKILSDAVKMVAYPAETAMVALLHRHLKKEEDARAPIRELFVSSGDIEPNNFRKKDHVRSPPLLHNDKAFGSGI